MKKMITLMVALFAALPFGVSATAKTSEKGNKPSIVEAGTAFQRNLNPGAKGPEVIRYQKFLAEQGLFTGDFSPNFGPRTTRATKELQRKLGLKADAIVGDLTRAAINRDVPAKATVVVQTKTSPTYRVPWKSAPSSVTVQINPKTIEKKSSPARMSSKSVQPSARMIGKIDPNIDPKMAKAAAIAQNRAYAHPKFRCWHFVKDALVAAGVIKSRPTTALAKQAAKELVEDYGFKKLPTNDPYAAPIGAVIVYNGPRGVAGHVEIRTKDGFVSDFRTKNASRRPIIGIYGVVVQHESL